MIVENKEEKLGSNLLYNFTKGYGVVPLEVYSIVLPLLLDATFSERLREHDSLASCIAACLLENSDFKKHIVKQIHVLKSITSQALDISRLHKDLDFQILDGVMNGSCNNAIIPEMEYATLLGKYVKGMTVDDIIGLLSNHTEKVIFLDSETLGSDIDVSCFAQLGQCTILEDTKQEAVASTIQEATIVITNKKILGREELENAEHLKLICVTATGFNNIDIAYCNEKGITVCNVKGYSTNSVAQHTFALLLDLYHKNRYYHDYIASGKYSSSSMFTHLDYQFHELEGKVWGIVGMGDIGQKVAKIAEVFGCHVQYYSTSGHNITQPYPCVTFETLLETSDIISIHAPLNEKTENLFDEQALFKMKSTAYLINVGRGKIIDEEALSKALRAQRIAGAGLDVFEKEPLGKDSPLLGIDALHLRMTPHIAWATMEARNRVVKEVYTNIESFLRGKPKNICVI